MIGEGGTSSTKGELHMSILGGVGGVSSGVFTSSPHFPMLMLPITMYEGGTSTSSSVRGVCSFSFLASSTAFEAREEMKE